MNLIEGYYENFKHREILKNYTVKIIFHKEIMKIYIIFIYLKKKKKNKKKKKKKKNLC